LHIQESFMGIIEVEIQKGQDLAFLITKETESVTDLPKIRGKGYDGAANMSGACLQGCSDFNEAERMHQGSVIFTAVLML